ncbi:exopolyphosphatase Ppx [Methyloglobulus morosus KoM1]|uniref:Exopolyphosphatase n=1 Tax=Methyloglobulus morosus KoM1 TaxID=1116472 RepID=V5B1A5_9GAMM|nr:exopolyphosphatase [Methyloglobulus morosus]ESS66955.1 exopolyphosphatase Ppx [Methyloglobulus morosus KoM1]
MQKKPPRCVAAVDLGSNSFHMIVCSLTDGKLQTVDRLREMVRLAAGLDKKNVLDHDTQKRALACLERFGQRIRDFPHDSVRAVGTNTLRNAKNAQQFLEKAEKALNHPIHIISGIEEARLIYQGVAHSVGSTADLRLVVDIGGGSTEYIIGEEDIPKKKESLSMGCVSMSKRFFPRGQLSKNAFGKSILYAELKLEPFQKKFHRKHWEQAIGSSGTLRSIDKVLQAKGWSNNGITMSGLENLVAHIKQCEHINELNLPDLDPERLPVFPGGVAIAYATFKNLDIDQMSVADGALREGLIQDLLGRIYDHDIRSATVKTLADRYHTDKHHANRIKQTIRHMLSQLSCDSCLLDKPEVEQFLEWAGELHEIGHDIAHNQYHKHSAYIIEHADLAGFTNQDQTLLATIIRCHKRKFPRSRFNELPAPWNNLAPFMTIILRLAVVLHRNRQEHVLPDFTIGITKSTIELRFPSGWLLNSPLTHADLIQEADYLKPVGFKLEFS